MNFKERTSPTTTVKIRKDKMPVVYINRSALNKMFIYTDEVQDEVGWLGTVQKVDNSYHITDVFLFDQQVHGATTEITPEGLTAFAEELLQRPDGMEIWNSMQMWGHSHVNMGITPSGQDNTQMEEFSKIGHKFFLRLICNKKGELAVDVYDYEAGIEYHNTPWVIHEDMVDEVGFHIQAQLKELQQTLEVLQMQAQEHQKAQIEEIKAPIKEEIKEKVRKFVYQTTKQPKTPYTHYGGWSGGSSKGYDYPDYSKKEDQIDGVKHTVYDFFTQKDLVMLAQDAYGYYDMQLLLEADGFVDFSDNDYMEIWREVKKFQDQMGLSNENLYGGYY